MKTEENNRFVISDLNDQPNAKKDRMVTGNGQLSLDGDLEITGYFSGMLKLNGNLTVAKNARIIGDFIALNMTVNGKIIGTATITGTATFNEGSEFSGILTADEAEVHEGSKISGIRKVRHSGGSAPRFNKEYAEEPRRRTEPAISRVNPIFNI